MAAATATAARKAPAKKKAAAPRRSPRPKAAVAEPVQDAVPEAALSGIVLDPERPAAPVEVFPIFKIGEVQYYAPVKPKAWVELKYLYLLRHKGDAEAGGFLLEELVGHDGYVALMNYRGLEAEDLERIIGALREAVDGAAMRGPKGKLTIT